MTKSAQQRHTVTTLLTTAMLSTVATSAAMPPPPRRNLKMPYLRDQDLQDILGPTVVYDKDKWLSISEDVQFLPLMDQQQQRRSLEEDLYYQDMSGENHSHMAYDGSNPFSVQPFIEGMRGYDELAQAWRLLGFIIDCNDVIYDDDYEEGGGSRDYVTDEACGRYVLWAAYVDTGYEGGGIGEYQYWNSEKNAWDDSACYIGNGHGENNGNYGNYKTRCAKMDCHLEDTHFSVLGFFKHRSHDDWMEQLFKHEGMCVWTDEEYSFMKEARRAWPKGCSDTGTTVKVSGSESTLYYDVKPLQNGRITIGLYIDPECLAEYPSDSTTIEKLLGNVLLEGDRNRREEGSHDGQQNNNNNQDSQESFADSLDKWNSAFDVWHTCHPCVAYDLNNTNGTKYYEEEDEEEDDYAYGDDGADDGGNRKLGGNYKARGEIFECYDDAGYTNVNQCMKFSAKTVMKTATFRDLSLGRRQNTLAKNPLAGYLAASHSQQFYKLRGETAATYIFLIASSTALLFSLLYLYKIVTRSKVGDASNSESLLDDE